jgi:hypothetical protein
MDMPKIVPECNCCGIVIRKTDKENYSSWLQHGWCAKCQNEFGEEDTENPLGVIERDEIQEETFEQEQESKAHARVSKKAHYSD